MPPARPAHQSVHDVELLSRSGLNMVDFLSDAMHVLGTAVPHAAACLATHDLSTGLLNGMRKYGALVGRNQGDVLYGQIENAEEETTSFRALVRNRVPAVGMNVLTDGDPRRSLRMRELVLPCYGFDDEARVVIRDGQQRWGVLSLFRGAGEQPFSRTEIAVLSRFSKHFARGIRSGILLQRSGATGARVAGPAILIVDHDDRVVRTTPSAETQLRQMSRDHHSGSPYAVIASLAAAARRTAPAEDGGLALIRMRGADGAWLTLQGVTLDGDDGPSAQVAITIEDSKPSETLDVVMAAYGFTDKERAVLRLVLDGRRTSEVARLLRLSPHTVNQHLRALFAKADVHSRGQLVARVLDDDYASHGQS